MLPQVHVEGRVVADPELRYSATGTPVARLRIVAASRKKDPDDPEGKKWIDDKTLWLDVTAFKSLAENIAESVEKGDLVIVLGRLQTDEWTNESGEKRSKIVCLADSVGPALNFRAIPHGAGKAERSSSGSAESDPWATPASSDEPPF